MYNAIHHKYTKHQLRTHYNKPLQNTEIYDLILLHVEQKTLLFYFFITSVIFYLHTIFFIIFCVVFTAAKVCANDTCPSNKMCLMSSDGPRCVCPDYPSREGDACDPRKYMYSPLRTQARSEGKPGKQNLECLCYHHTFLV